MWFIRNLYAKGWSKERIIELFYFIDGIMRLPDYLESVLWDEILKFEQDPDRLIVIRDTIRMAGSIDEIRQLVSSRPGQA